MQMEPVLAFPFLRCPGEFELCRYLSNEAALIASGKRHNSHIDLIAVVCAIPEAVQHAASGRRCGKPSPLHRLCSLKPPGLHV